ncbi:right-handed parallel beta-helix repeat-containing protein [Methylosinus sp. Sm6]|uniref:right-handed parallel beta-helix repeat-containing protein n=1 Tax=Methylosinus sp. Sm6 TaxID=2866948 RepID=UPI001C99F273|nr:right-handed parallel beta-helix repeat-containing protein [Methylosinus sp. Sm6]MBY6239869.1 right-handed parallel beta-helix repeat-containing protein [Methylosinus sp. Sm6]
MTMRISWLAALAAAALLALASQGAQAQAARTFVSASGDDTKPCSRTAPCKTFSAAISKTAAGGEINCVDSGPFGAFFSIQKALSIVCDDVRAEVLVVNNDAITISAGAGDDVLLSGLHIRGVTTSFSGVRVLQARSVAIRNSTIRGFHVAGINVIPSVPGATISLQAFDTRLAENPGVGVRVKPASGASANVMLSGVHVSGGGADGALFDASATTGKVNGLVRDSVFASNATNGLAVVSNGAAAVVLVESSEAIDNATGLSASGSGAVVRFTKSDMSANATAVSQANAGVAQSFATNAMAGNAADGSFGATPLQ